jgi:hypothetical protein
VCCLRTLRSYSQWSAMQWSGRHASESLHLVLDRLLELHAALNATAAARQGRELLQPQPGEQAKAVPAELLRDSCGGSSGAFSSSRHPFSRLVSHLLCVPVTHSQSAS